MLKLITLNNYMKILTLEIGFWVEKGLKNNLDKNKIDFMAKNRYLLPLI